MILFKAAHVPMILDGTKTQTRRLWPHGCRARVGSTHWAQTSLKPDSRFARLRIKQVWRQPLHAISWAEAKAEGYESPLLYVQAFARINGQEMSYDLTHTVVWAVEFEREEAPPCLSPRPQRWHWPANGSGAIRYSRTWPTP